MPFKWLQKQPCFIRNVFPLETINYEIQEKRAKLGVKLLLVKKPEKIV